MAFLVIGRELHRGRPVKDIAVMRGIAEVTVMAGMMRFQPVGINNGHDLPEMAVCHEYRRSKRRYATVREMKEGPSGSAIRS